MIRDITGHQSAVAEDREAQSHEESRDREHRCPSATCHAAWVSKTRLEYTYEVVELDPGRRLVMRTDAGPFPMGTTYSWEDAGAGRTRMTLHRGEPSGFSRIALPLMTAAMRRANRKDLDRLRRILEGGG